MPAPAAPARTRRPTASSRRARRAPQHPPLPSPARWRAGRHPTAAAAAVAHGTVPTPPRRPRSCSRPHRGPAADRRCVPPAHPARCRAAPARPASRDRSAASAPPRAPAPVSSCPPRSVPGSPSPRPAPGPATHRPARRACPASPLNVRPRDSCVPPAGEHRPQEERRADQRRDDADLQLRPWRQIPRNRIGEEQQRRAAQERGGQQRRRSMPQKRP